MWLKFKLFLLKPIYFIRKILLNYYFKILDKKNSQLHKYDQILTALKASNGYTLNSLFNELSGDVIQRDYKEIPKAGRYSIFKRHPTYDSFSYLQDSCQSLLDKNFLSLDNGVFKLKPFAKEFLEEKQGFVKELGRKKLNDDLDILYKVVKILAVFSPLILAIINSEFLFKLLDSFLHSTFCD